MHYSKGYVKIEKYEAVFENGEWIPIGIPVDCVETTNGLSLNRYLAFMGLQTSVVPGIGSTTTYELESYPLKIFISELSSKAPACDPGAIGGTTVSAWSGTNGLVTFGETLLEWNYEDKRTTDNTVVLTVKYRFNPDVNKTRKIRSVGLVKNNVTQLDQAFEQTSTQILDVQYTVVVDVGNVSGVFKRNQARLRLATAISSHDDDISSTQCYNRSLIELPHTNINQYWTSQVSVGGGQTGTGERGGVIGVGAVDGDGSINGQPYNTIGILDGVRSTSNVTYSDLAAEAGRLIGSIATGKRGGVGSFFNSTFVPTGYSPYSGNFFDILDFFYVNDSNSGSAIQNTFGKTTASRLPYQDIDALANGTGTLILDDSTSLKPSGSGWTGNVSAGGFAKKYRVEIKNSGQVGTATYNVKSRNWFGTTGNTHDYRYIPITTTTAECSIETNIGRTSRVLPWAQDSDFGYHGQYGRSAGLFTQYNTDYAANNMSAFIPYVYPEFISYDRTGITIAHVNNGGINVEFNNVVQVVAKKTGEIYVADLNGGLYRIDRALLSRNFTKTKITVSNAANDSICRGVQIKKDGTIWAVLDEELCSSSDNGVNWTVYNATTPTQFKIDGILDTSNGATEPTRIAGFVMDRYNVQDRFLFPTRTAGGVSDYDHAVNWWSRAGSSGGTSDQLYVANISSEAWPNIGYMPTVGIFCTKNGLWMIITPGPSGTGAPRVAQFKGTWYSQGQWDNSQFVVGNHAVIWWEDSDNGSEFVLGFDGPADRFCAVRTDDYDSTASSGGYSLIGGTESGVAHVYKRVSDGSFGGYFQYGNNSHQPLAMLEPGSLLISIPNQVDNRDSRELYLVSLTGSTTDGGDQGQTWGAWKTYGWNGSQWVLGDSSPRVTHSTQEPLIDGLNIQFQDGATGTSFIDTEYYDTYVYNGILKDNATTVDLTYNSSILEITSVTDFESTVPASDLGNVTEPLYGLSQYASYRTVIPWFEPGLIYIPNVYNNSNVQYARTEPRLVGDFSISFKIKSHDISSNSNGAYTIGLRGYSTTTDTNIPNDATYNESLRLNERWSGDSDGIFNMSIKNNAHTLLSDISVTDWSPNDTFTISRTGDTVTYSRNGSVMYTSAISYTGDLQLTFWKTDNNRWGQMLLEEGVVTYTHQNSGRYVNIGNGISTGRSDPNFRKVIQDSRIRDQYNQVFINGTPATINYDLSTPSPGTCTLLPYSGRLWFDSADAGATITGKLGYVSVMNPV